MKRTTPGCSAIAKAMNSSLVLSIFPGADLLGLAFEQEGFCVVRGPDPIFGSLHDVRLFHPPADTFAGVIGGPPCQSFSRLHHLNPLAGQRHGNLIPEFERVVQEARPLWFLMENVPEAPLPRIPGYWPAPPLLINNRWLGAEQQRLRRFSFSVCQAMQPVVLDISPDLALFEAALVELAVTSHTAAIPIRLVRDGHGGHRPKRPSLRPPAVLGGHGDGSNSSRMRGLSARSISEMCRLQGIPEDFLDDAPFTAHGKRQLVGNGVPLPMGRAVAAAIKRAVTIEYKEAT